MYIFQKNNFHATGEGIKILQVCQKWPVVIITITYLTVEAGYSARKLFTRCDELLKIATFKKSPVNSQHSCNARWVNKRNIKLTNRWL